MKTIIMACLLPLFLCFSLLDSVYSQELHQDIQSDGTNYHYNGIPLQNHQRNSHQDRIPQQQYPQWTKQGSTNDHNDNDASEQCAMVSQVQSVVIQILSTHYEYGKGIHTLHALVDSIQNDIASLKSDVKNTEKSQGKLMNKFGLNQNFTSDTVPEDQSGYRNLTSTVRSQTHLLEKLEKKHKSLRRTVSKMLTDVTKLQGLDTKDTVQEVLSQFMEQQKELNANLARRVRHLEEKLISSGYREGRRTRYGDPSYNVILQNDAPPTKPETECPSGFMRHLLSCYRFENSTKTWVEAEKHCQTLHPHSHLVAIETRAEQKFLMEYRNHNTAHWSSAYMWAGGTDMYTPPQWTWVATNRPLLYTHWRPGEPSKPATGGTAGEEDGHPHCIYFRSQLHHHGRDVRDDDGQWDDWHCTAARLNYVCEIMLKA